MTMGFLVGLLIALMVECGLLVGRVLVQRRRNGGVVLPAWLITADRPSPQLRAVVARMARASARDVMAEWDTVPPGLQKHLRMEIARMIAEAFAVHSGRRKLEDEDHDSQ